MSKQEKTFKITSEPKGFYARYEHSERRYLAPIHAWLNQIVVEEEGTPRVVSWPMVYCSVHGGLRLAADLEGFRDVRYSRERGIGKDNDWSDAANAAVWVD